MSNFKKRYEIVKNKYKNIEQSQKLQKKQKLEERISKDRSIDEYECYKKQNLKNSSRLERFDFPLGFIEISGITYYVFNRLFSSKEAKDSGLFFKEFITTNVNFDTIKKDPYIADILKEINQKHPDFDLDSILNEVNNLSPTFYQRFNNALMSYIKLLSNSKNIPVAGKGLEKGHNFFWSIGNFLTGNKAKENPTNKIMNGISVLLKHKEELISEIEYFKQELGLLSKIYDQLTQKQSSYVNELIYNDFEIIQSISQQISYYKQLYNAFNMKNYTENKEKINNLLNEIKKGTSLSKKIETLKKQNTKFFHYLDKIYSEHGSYLIQEKGHIKLLSEKQYSAVKQHDSLIHGIKNYSNNYVNDHLFPILFTSGVMLYLVFKKPGFIRTLGAITRKSAEGIYHLSDYLLNKFKKYR